MYEQELKTELQQIKKELSTLKEVYSSMYEQNQKLLKRIKELEYARN